MCLSGRSGEAPGFPYGDKVVFLANDWHAGLVPTYIAGKYRQHGVYKVRLGSAYSTCDGALCIIPKRTHIAFHGSAFKVLLYQRTLVCANVRLETQAQDGLGPDLHSLACLWVSLTQDVNSHLEVAVQDARCIFAIHNLSHQGVEPAVTFPNFGLPDNW